MTNGLLEQIRAVDRPLLATIQQWRDVRDADVDGFRSVSLVLLTSSDGDVCSCHRCVAFFGVQIKSYCFLFMFTHRRQAKCLVILQVSESHQPGLLFFERVSRLGTFQPITPDLALVFASSGFTGADEELAVDSIVPAQRRRGAWRSPHF